MKIDDFSATSAGRGAGGGRHGVRRLRGNADRCLLAVGDAWILKGFGPAHHRNYQIESRVGAVLRDAGVSAPAIEMTDEDAAGWSIILFQRAEGTIFNDVYRSLGASDYLDVLRAMGRVYRTLHAVPIDRLADVPCFQRGHPQYFNTTADRPRALDAIVPSLMDADLLDAATAAWILEAIGTAGLFLSDPALIHTDIHNENLFVSREPWAVQFIDWETARIEPREVDLVHPFLNIFGEFFPEDGYDAGVPWAAVAAHAAAWYLDLALAEHQRGNPRLRDFYLRTAIGGLNFVAR